MLANLYEKVDSVIKNIELNGITSTTFEPADGKDVDYISALNFIKAGLSNEPNIATINMTNYKLSPAQLYSKMKPNQITVGDVHNADTSFFNFGSPTYVAIRPDTFNYAIMVEFMGGNVAINSFTADGKVYKHPYVDRTGVSIGSNFQYHGGYLNKSGFIYNYSGEVTYNKAGSGNIVILDTSLTNSMPVTKQPIRLSPIDDLENEIVGYVAKDDTLKLYVNASNITVGTRYIVNATFVIS